MAILCDIHSAADNAAFIAATASFHTCNGDSIEVYFTQHAQDKGMLSTGFVGGFERFFVTVHFDKEIIEIGHSDWTRPRPRRMPLPRSVSSRKHRLLITKAAGSGDLVKMANLEVVLDGVTIFKEQDLNILPEIAAFLNCRDGNIDRVVHRGEPRVTGKKLHIGGWQVLNKNSIRDNTDSIIRGIQAAAERGVELLVTPETCLTGLFPAEPVTRNKSAIAAAEREIQRALRKTKHAPYLVMGLPVWRNVTSHRRVVTRFNASQVYDPDGHVIATCDKIHSCEPDFWHGYRLNEFDINDVPVCMHICHDARYPEVWTLPVMFGGRLIVHPANGGAITGSIASFESQAIACVPGTSNAFYIHVNGGGGSYITGPQGKHNKLLAVSDECLRQSESFPLVGEPQECLIDADIAVDNAYGYWPVRSFRASEQAAAAYYELYQALGGKRAL